MIKSKSWIRLVSLGCLSAAVLGACSSSKGGNDAGKVEVDFNVPVTFTMFGNSSQSQEYFDRYYGNDLKKKFPNYTFNYIQTGNGVNMETLITSGTAIDIFYATINNFQNLLVKYGLEVDMTNLIKVHNIDTSKFEPSQLTAMRLNTGGPIYGVPIQGNVQTLYYNKDMFDRFGVPYPKDNMTWDDAAEISRRMTRNDNGKQYYGYGTSPGHLLRTNQLSVGRVDAKTGLPILNSDPKWKLFFETAFVKMMSGEAFKQEYTKGTRLSGINSFIKDQDTAMFSYMAQLYLTNPAEMKTFNWDIVTLPTFKEAPGVGSQQYPMFFGITKQTKNVPAAMEVLKYLSSEEYQIGLARKGWMSSLSLDSVQKQYAQDTEFKDKNYKALFTMKPAAISIMPDYDPEIVTAYTAIVRDILRGSADLNTAFRTAEEKSLQIVEDAKRAAGK